MKGSQNLPAKLKELRKKNHYSQEQVAEKLNISRQAISNWETGKAYPDIDNLVMLSELYGASVDEMLGTGEALCKTDNTTILTQHNNEVLEMMGLAVVLILSLNIPFGGILTSVIIIWWLKHTKRKYSIIYMLCIVCFVVSLQEIFVYYSHAHILYGNMYYEFVE